MFNGLGNFLGGVGHAVGNFFHPQPQKPQPQYDLGSFLRNTIGAVTNPVGTIAQAAPKVLQTRLPGMNINAGQVIQQLPMAALRTPGVVAKGAYNGIVQPYIQNAGNVATDLNQAQHEVGWNQNAANKQLAQLDQIDAQNQAAFKAGKINLTRLKALNQDTINSRNQVTGALNKEVSQYRTTGQAVGDLGQLGANLGSAIAGGSGAESKTLGQAVLHGALPNAGYGAVSGGLTALSNKGSAGDVAKQALLGGAQGAVMGGVLGAGGYGLTKLGTAIKENPQVLMNERGSVALGNDNTPSLDQNGNPIKAVNKFQQSVKDSPNIPADIQKQVEVGTHNVRNTEALDQAAVAMVDKNPDIATHMALAGNDDKSVAIANVLMQRAAAKGDAATVNQIATDTANALIEHGRAVQAASLIDKMSPEGTILTTNRLLAKAGAEPLQNEAAAGLLQQAKDLAAMPEGRDKLIAQGKLQQAIGKQIPSSNTDKAVSLWKAGLLTGPKTVGKIAISNPLMGTLETIKDFPAAAADKVTSLFTGKRTLTAPDLAQAGAYASGAKQGLQDAGTYLTTGVKMPNSSGFGMEEFANHTNFKNAVLQAYTELPGKVHGAISMPFFEGKFAQSLTQQGEAEALNQGLKGAEKASFIRDFMANPSKKALALASNDAQHATLQNKTMLGSLASDLQKKGGPVGQFLAPFTRIPGAVATALADYSPVGPVKEAITQIHAGNGLDQRALSQAIGRTVTGTGIMALGWALMNAGHMTGAFPTNKDEQAQWQLEGKQPNSILVGGKWRSIGSLGPAANALLTGGEAAKGWADNGIGGTLAQGVGGAAKSITDQPYLTGISGAMNAIQTPSQATAFLNQSAGSFIPTGIKQLATATDPLQRQITTQSPVTSVKNSVLAGIPGLRETVLPKQNVFGQDQARQGSTLSNLIDPTNPTTATTDPLISELNRLQNTVDPTTGKPFSTISQVDKKIPVTHPGAPSTHMSDQSRQQFIASTGPVIQSQLNNLIQTPEYQGAGDAAKQKVMSNIISQIRTEGKLNAGDGSPIGSAPTDQSINVNKIANAAQLTLAKDSFDKSGKNYQVVGNTVLRRDTSGNITATPKIKYDYQLGTATLTSQKNAGDINGYLQTAQKQLANIGQQLQDSSIDPLDALTLQNAANTLQSNMQKYAGYGGFTKGKSVKAAKGTKVAGLATAKVRIAKVPSFKVATSHKSLGVKLPKMVKSSNKKLKLVA